MTSKYAKMVEDFLAKKAKEREKPSAPKEEVEGVPSMEVRLPELGAARITLKGVRIHIDEVIIKRVSEEG
jgi:CO dehydrogenase/acetyl-CoA synthase beta subunit